MTNCKHKGKVICIKCGYNIAKLTMPEYRELKKYFTKNKEQDILDCTVQIIEQIIEPLHYPQRGVNGEKYYALEDKIKDIIIKYL